MIQWRNTKAWLIGLAAAGIPLVTIGSCDPVTGFFDFYRDDDYDGYYYEDVYYYDDYYYTDYDYDDYYYDECFFCFP